jgi:proteic killer suppression protein
VACPSFDSCSQILRGRGLGVLAPNKSLQRTFDMDLPGYKLHSLKGKRKGLWSITVSGNWRITFEFTDGNVYIVNYEDYH